MLAGAKKHILEDFGRLTDTYGDAYRAYYGVWRWQDYSDPRARFATRDGWYGRHVAREEVLPPLEAALRWMSLQPELQRRDYLARLSRQVQQTGRTSASAATGLRGGAVRKALTG